MRELESCFYPCDWMDIQYVQEFFSISQTPMKSKISTPREMVHEITKNYMETILK